MWFPMRWINLMMIIVFLHDAGLLLMLTIDRWTYSCCCRLFTRRYARQSWCRCDRFVQSSIIEDFPKQKNALFTYPNLVARWGSHSHCLMIWIICCWFVDHSLLNRISSLKCVLHLNTTMMKLPDQAHLAKCDRTYLFGFQLTHHELNATDWHVALDRI